MKRDFGAMLQKLLRRIQKGRKQSKSFRTGLYAIGAVLVFLTTYMMILPAITIERDVAVEEPGMNITSQSVRESDYADISGDQKKDNDEDRNIDNNNSNDRSNAQQKEDDIEGKDKTDTLTNDDHNNSTIEDQQNSRYDTTPDQDDADHNDDQSVEDNRANDQENDQDSSLKDNQETGTDADNPGPDFGALITDPTTLIWEGDDYQISAYIDEYAMLPEGVSLQVKEIRKNVQKEKKQYQGYYDKALQEINKIDGNSKDDPQESFTYARFFDISFVKDGQEIEPAYPVDITITLDQSKNRTAVEGADSADLKEEDKIRVVHFNESGKKTKVEELINDSIKDKKEKNIDIQFTGETFSVYGVVYTVDYFYEVAGHTYGFTMQGTDSVSLRALIEALHVYEADSVEDEPDADTGEIKTEAVVTNADLAGTIDSKSPQLDSFMKNIEAVTFSNEELLVPAKVVKDTTAGKLKTELKLFPTYPLGLKQSEIVALNAKEYKAGDWALISMKAFDTEETLTVTMKNGNSFTILVTDAQDAVMNGDVVQTISNPAGTTIDLFDYWIVSQDLVGRDGWGDLNQGQGAAEAGDDKPLNGTGNNKGINSSTTDSEHGHALKFSPAWTGTVYNGNKVGTTGEAWRSVNMDGRNGLNSYTGSATPFQGIVTGTLVGGYPMLTENSTIGSNGESLAYLFDPGMSHDGKKSYSGVNQLLYVDKDGYYTYDSRDYSAEFSGGTFTLREQTSTNGEIRGFWPFGTQNFWAGMHLNTQFSMPTNGQVLNPQGENKDMQFEFSGDDDTWLYVDGVLVGDGGGIHNRTEIDINFATGKVIVTGEKDASHGSGFNETKYLDDIFKAAGKYTETDWEDIGDGSGHKRFKAGTYHTFDMFYLERGGGESNLYIHYNLISTADFTAHKSYYGADQTDLLRRDQFQFELIGLDGKYRSVKNTETGEDELILADQSAEAIMPHASGTGAGTVESPHYEDDVTTTLSTGGVNSQIYITGVTEDGNINFGSAVISEIDMNEADNGNPPVYRYMIREIVPDDAKNANGVTWASATDAQKAAGGFVKDQITYDGTVYYMTGQVTSWTETNASGQEIVRHGIYKTYYTDDTYTTVKSDVNFASFENRFTPDFGNVDFKKVDGAGEPLEGAEFTLYKDEACTIPAVDLDTEGRPEWTAASDSNGKVSFENVRVGTYYMKETSAPSEYALDETVYKVVIEDSKDKTKESRITILGDGTETKITEIANAKSGKITVIKKWLDASGKEVDGGSNSATVWLKRKHMVAEETPIGSHNVTVTQSVVNYGGGDQQMFGQPTIQSVSGDTVVIEWDDEWQDNFNWTLQVGANTYEGYIGDGNTVSGPCYTIEKIDVEGRSRRLTVTDITGDVTFTTKYHINWLYTDGTHWANLNNPSISGIAAEPNYVAVEDSDFNNEKHTQALSGNGWSHTWNIGGTVSSHSGFELPAMDDNGKNYLYYVVELDAQGYAIEVGGSPLEGYVLRGYSPNNNTGISNQGVIMVYNQAEGSEAINVVIKKTDNAQNSTNYLDGAVFKLLYGSDSSGTFANVSYESVPELDSNSQFAVPKEGITLTGLVDGQYQLQELSPPSGYVITNSTPVTFTVSGGIITSTAGSITDVRYIAATGDSYAEFIIPNTPGTALPNTGGPGTKLIYLLGIMFVGIAGAGMLMRKRGNAA